MGRTGGSGKHFRVLSAHPMEGLVQLRRDLTGEPVLPPGVRETFQAVRVAN